MSPGKGAPLHRKATSSPFWSAKTALKAASDRAIEAGLTPGSAASPPPPARRGRRGALGGGRKLHTNTVASSQKKRRVIEKPPNRSSRSILAKALEMSGLAALNKARNRA